MKSYIVPTFYVIGLTLLLGSAVLLNQSVYPAESQTQVLDGKYSFQTRPPPASQPITLLFVGDIMLSRNIGELMLEHDDWHYPFLDIAEFTSGADITFGNLEGPISARGAKVGSVYSFRADPRAIEGLRYAGFDVLSIANNHIWDYGPEAAADTVSLLRQAGIGVAGGGDNYGEAHQPVIKEVGDTQVAFLAYTNLISAALGRAGAGPAIAYLDLLPAARDVGAAEAQADVVVVSLHWGDEYETTPNLDQERIGQALIDAGADLIIGHHPHVVQPVAAYADGYIAYSLGNFVFDQNFSAETQTGLALEVTWQDKKISQVTPIKIRFTSSYQPYLAGL